MKEKTDTIIAPLTPSVGGSVALLRISGEQAFDLTNKFFPSRKLEELSGNTFIYGNLVDEQKRVIDQVVLLLYRAPKSYTGENTIEISCHANPFIVKEIIDLYRRNGCRLAEPGEFSKRAFINDKMDLVQAEAVADLITARSRAAVANSVKQLGGGLSERFKSIRENLITTASFLELELDFSEEDIEIVEPKKTQSLLKEIRKQLSALSRSYSSGSILQQGVEALITGKPNVGKSSLMNALLEQDRVIVSSTPGTTRDLVHETIVIENVLVRLIDTAGMRLSDDPIEAEGVEKARKYFEHANMVLLIVDASQPLDNQDNNLIKTISAVYREKLLLIGNKADLGINKSTEKSLKNIQSKTMFLSAKTGQNIDRLKKEILRRFFVQTHLLEEEVLISNPRQKEKIDEAVAFIRKAESGLKQGGGYEFIAYDLRSALNALAEITGDITTEDILNNIFSHFCIGK